MRYAAIKVRKYQPTDVQDIGHIYFDTIHTINARDYTEDQINAWAPYRDNYEKWAKKLEKTQPIVATIGSKIVGFAEFEPNGHIDCFYVHHQFQSCGIGSTLINEIEKMALSWEINEIFAEVSITAKGFFTKMGFDTVKQQSVVVRGVELTNFVMKKELAVKIQPMQYKNISEVVEAFKKIGWNKESSLFERYIGDAENGLRKCWIARHNGKFAGYVTLAYESNYKKFMDDNIPEVVDLNVLPDFRRKGIGQKLLETAETEAFKHNNVVGIGVGLYGGEDGGYGQAQRLYVKNGYIPDGNGVTYNGVIATPDRNYQLDDDCILWMKKVEIS